MRLQIAVSLDGELLAHQEWVVPGRAMQFLAPAVEEMLSRLCVRTADLGGVACVRGPGAFTGLRLVMATALGIALGAGLPMAGLDYLELLAREPVKALCLPVAVLTHSRRREVYYREFVPWEGGMRPLAPVAALALEPAATRLRAFTSGGPVRVLGSGLRRNFPVLSEVLPRGAVLPPSFDNPRPEALIEAAAEADWDMQGLQPYYVRGSDAEENLESIAASRGLDFEEAKRTLHATN
jgi:tRNA threonylcarbamoyladenosine biosynthesis protein TsaB